MTRIGFADESGIDEHSVCYAIGVVSVPLEGREDFEALVRQLKDAHGILGEAKWTRIRNSHGAINFAIACLELVFTFPGATFDVMVVDKHQYRNWRGSEGREVAFYKTYTYLLRHIARRARTTTTIEIDARSDKYAKRDEAMLTIGNRMLAKLAARGDLGSVTKVSSRDSLGVQVADVLTGAINTAHLMALKPRAIHPGKLLAIARLAECLGWPSLTHDTYPHDRLNVWHFPIEFRGPSRDPRPVSPMPKVTREELEGFIAAHGKPSTA